MRSKGNTIVFESKVAEAKARLETKVAEALGVSTDMLVFGEQLQAGEEPIVFKDKELASKLKELDAFSEDEKEVAHYLLDLVLAKNKLEEVVGGLRKESAKVSKKKK